MIPNILPPQPKFYKATIYLGVVTDVYHPTGRIRVVKPVFPLLGLVQRINQVKHTCHRVISATRTACTLLSICASSLNYGLRGAL